MNELQEKYARVILESCLGVEKNQPLFISYNNERSDFVRVVTKIAYFSCNSFILSLLVYSIIT